MRPKIGSNIWVMMMQIEHALLLAAGEGTRLMPLTKIWPKCLMPIGGQPLLSHWIDDLLELDVKNILVNTCHHSDKVEEFLARPSLYGKVSVAFEKELLGTAGTIIANGEVFGDGPAMIIHADNWCHCNLKEFCQSHHRQREQGALISMMTFSTQTPKTCGIVELDDSGFVISMHEKVDDPPGNLANAAVYIVEADVIAWMRRNPHLTDFSTQVLPHFMGQIAAWHNLGHHIDIGSVEMLLLARQSAPVKKGVDDAWAQWFDKHEVHDLIKKLERSNGISKQ